MGIASNDENFCPKSAKNCNKTWLTVVFAGAYYPDAPTSFDRLNKTGITQRLHTEHLLPAFDLP